MSAVLKDYRERVLDQVAEGDKVASRIEGDGTVVGELLGIQGNGRRIATSAIVITEFGPDGRITEEWVLADTLRMVQQLSG